MTCEQLNALLPEYWGQTLTAAQELEFEAHMQSCATCGAEFTRLDGLWRGLPEVADVAIHEPGAAIRHRFYEALGAYRQGVESIEIKRPWWSPASFGWQAAAAAALIGVGLGAGYALHSDTSKPELAQLRQEVTSMRQMVTLSLLQQQSASERMRGVSWANRSEPGNNQVLAALVSAVNNDPNVNVRLAAVDALHAFAASPVTGQETREAVVAALPRDQPPLVQVALIDLLVDMKDRDASPELRRLASDDMVNPGVKQRALWAAGVLEQ